MEEQERFERQNASYETYMNAIRTKFDSLNITQRERTLGDMEFLLSTILRMGNNKPSRRSSQFNRTSAREIRVKEGLNQEQLAHRVGLTQGTISKYERGADNPSEEGKGNKYLSWLLERGYKNGN